MVDRYVNQPDLIFAAGKYVMADQMCSTEFLRCYYLFYKSIHSDNQPEEVTDNLLEGNSLCSPLSYPKILSLMSIRKNCIAAKRHLY